MKAKPQYVVRIRTYPKATLSNGVPYPWTDIWLLEREGAADQCLLQGQITADKLAALMDLFDHLEGVVTIDREVSPLAGSADEDEAA